MVLDFDENPVQVPANLLNVNIDVNTDNSTETLNLRSGAIRRYL